MVNLLSEPFLFCILDSNIRALQFVLGKFSKAMHEEDFPAHS